MRWMLAFFFLLNSAVNGVWADPVSPEEAGVEPLTPNVLLYRFGKEYARGGQPVVAILDNNRIAVAWQDNSADIGAGWILLNEKGEILNKTIRCLQKPDGTRTAVEGMYFPQLAANLFGGGFLFGVTYYDWHGSVNPANRMAEWAKRFGEENAPLLQQIDSNGAYRGSCFLGLPEEFVARKGQIRLADAGYLSNGNIVLVAEDMQDRDGPDWFHLHNADRVAIASIVNPTGELLYGPAALHQSDRTQNTGVIWYGLAIGKDGFGVRCDVESAKVRFFNNRLKPVTDEIAVQRELAEGGRGENVGWHGNGKNEFLLVSAYYDKIYYQIYNLQGVPKFKVNDAQPMDNNGFYRGRCDGAIDADGRFVVAGIYLPVDPQLDGTRTAVAARYFNADGTPITPPFWVSSVPSGDWAAQDMFPRIAMRNGLLAVVWVDRNTNLFRTPELAVRIFRLPK